MHIPSRKYPHGFTPPNTGNAPARVKRIVGEEYGKLRERDVKANPSLLESRANKTKNARVAWLIAERETGYKPR